MTNVYQSIMDGLDEAIQTQIRKNMIKPIDIYQTRDVELGLTYVSSKSEHGLHEKLKKIETVFNENEEILEDICEQMFQYELQNEIVIEQIETNMRRFKQLDDKFSALDNRSFIKKYIPEFIVEPIHVFVFILYCIIFM